MTTTDAGTTSDDDLLRRCVEDDREALGILFDRYKRQVYAAAIVLLENPTDAEDVLSDTFVTFWRKRAAITLFAGSALPWLITTARNQAKNLLRSRHRSRTTELDDDRAAPESDSAETVAGVRSLQRLLDAELSRLAPVDQRIVHLCLVDGASYEEAARLLGLSHGTVRNRLARARAQLRSNLSTEREDR